MKMNVGCTRVRIEIETKGGTVHLGTIQTCSEKYGAIKMLDQGKLLSRAVCSKSFDGQKEILNLNGPIRESNPGPPAPEAGIMPLDQLDT